MFEAEADNATTLVNGRYRLFNNVWNRGAAVGPYRQKIFINEDKGKTICGWVWEWEYSYNVVSYPEIMVGVSPWSGETTPNSGFPFRVGTKKVVVNYDATVEATGRYNLAFEFWAVSGLPATKDRITHEVMIWVASNCLGAVGLEVDRVTIQGNTFSVNVRRNHGDASGVHKKTWTIIPLVAHQPVLHGPLDIGQIIDYLVEHGHLDRRLYVAGIELGNEVMFGSGTTVIRNFEVTVQ